MRLPLRPAHLGMPLGLVCLLAAAQEAAPAKAVDGRFARRIREHAAEESWTAKLAKVQPTRNLVVESLELARAYYLNNQLPEGAFVARRDLIDNTADEDDAHPRQAGALWALACLNRDRHTPDTQRAVIRGLDFFHRCSQPLKSGQIAPVHAAADDVRAVTLAFVCLAIVDLWRGQEPDLAGLGRGFYDSWLETYLAALQSLEGPDGGWAMRYIIPLNERDPERSGAADGAALLAYCRAARAMGRSALIPRIERSALQLAEYYTLTAWKKDPGSEDSRWFAPHGCLAFAEYVEAGWKDAEAVGDAAMALAWWLIHEHAVEARTANSAYALEALLGAYRIARHRRDFAAMERLRTVCERLLVRQISWQAGGPLRDLNPFLRERPLPPKAAGGFMTAKDSGLIRIEVMQQQVHAMLMALELLFPETRGTPPPRRAPR